MSLPARLQKFFGDKNMTLKQRLRNGKGADRELDAKLFRYFHPDIETAAEKWTAFPWPHYTSDLNAVFALVERELPGAHVTWVRAPRMSEVSIWNNEQRTDAILHSDACRTLLLALLAAKEPPHGR